MPRSRLLIFAGLFLTSYVAFADIFGSIRGVVHDPQHRPVDRAMVMLHSKSSDWVATTNTDAAGQFTFGAVPLGEYTVTVASPGFLQTAQPLVVTSGPHPVLHYPSNLVPAKQP